MAALPDGGFLIGDSGNDRIRRVWPDAHISTVAGNGKRGFSGDGGPATAASLYAPGSVAVLPDGGFLITDGNRVRRVWPDRRISSVLNGSTRNMAVGGLAVMPDGGVLISGPDRVWRLSPDGHTSVVAGNGTQGFSGDGGPATAASLDASAIAALPDGGFLIAEGFNDRVRRVWRDGHISTVAGDGKGATGGGGGAPFSGEGAPATAAR